MHDATAARNEGIAICFRHFPDVEVLLDDGYLGLSRDRLPDTYHAITGLVSNRTANI